MKAFADLYSALDETTKTTAKVRALKDYFAKVPAEDAAWAVYFLIGRKPRQVVPSGKLRAWAAEEAKVPDWLFQESYDAVGDVAETIALLLPTPERSSDSPLSFWIEQRLLPLRGEKRGGPAHGHAPGLARAGPSAALRLEQADQRRVSRRGLAAARDPGAGRSRRDRPGRGGSSFDGRLGAVPRLLHATAGQRSRRRRREPPLSVLSGPCSGSARRGAGRSATVAGRMEMGRHPLPAHPASRADLPLVARRGAGDRALSRAGRRRRCPARGHGRRRRDPALEGRAALAVRSASEANRPQGGDPRDPGAGAGDRHGVRPARVPWGGRPRLAARPAPCRPGRAGRGVAA